jgi:hypothetical protein
MVDYSNLNTKDEAFFGRKYGKPCNILRVGDTLNPDYSVASHDPYQVGKGKFFICKTSNRFAFTDNSDVELFRVTGDRGRIRIGDILETVNNARGTLPIVTVLDYADNQTCTAFKTDRVGDIKNGDTAIFSDIKFSFVPNSEYIGPPLNREMMASLGIAKLVAVTFKKPLDSAFRDAAGLYLNITDSTPNQLYLIEEATDFGNLQMLTLKRVT